MKQNEPWIAFVHLRKQITKSFKPAVDSQEVQPCSEPAGYETMKSAICYSKSENISAIWTGQSSERYSPLKQRTLEGESRNWWNSAWLHDSWVGIQDHFSNSRRRQGNEETPNDLQPCPRMMHSPAGATTLPLPTFLLDLVTSPMLQGSCALINIRIAYLRD